MTNNINGNRYNNGIHDQSVVNSDDFIKLRRELRRKERRFRSKERRRKLMVEKRRPPLSLKERIQNNLKTPDQIKDYLNEKYTKYKDDKVGKMRWAGYKQRDALHAIRSNEGLEVAKNREKKLYNKFKAIKKSLVKDVKHEKGKYESYLDSICGKSKYFIVVRSDTNNTFLSLVEGENNLPICTTTPGAVGFKGGKRKTGIAVQVAIKKLMNAANLHYQKGVEKEKREKRGSQLVLGNSDYKKSVMVVFKGFGPGRNPAARGLRVDKGRLLIKSFVDSTKIPFNGCRPPKSRRI